MKNKKKYRDLCKHEETIPIFSQAWWLDSVCGDSWDVCLVEKNNQIIAAMPYAIEKKLGFNLIVQPRLTQSLGPWFRVNEKNERKKLSQQKKLMFDLIEQLPSYSYFQQSWSVDQDNWLPFYWKGFSQTTKYTYIINLEKSLDEILKGFSSSYRNKIRKAEKIVEIKSGLSPDKFYEINKKTFNRQGINIPYSYSFFKKHDESIKRMKGGKVFYAEDLNGNIHSALYLTWDRRSAFVHLVGEDSNYRNSGAGILLIWEAIKYSKNYLKLTSFDFEGSMIESVERVRRDCGGVQHPYFSITKHQSKLLKILMFLRLVKI